MIVECRIPEEDGPLPRTDRSDKCHKMKRAAQPINANVREMTRGGRAMADELWPDPPGVGEDVGLAVPVGLDVD